MIQKNVTQLCEDKPEDIWFHEKLSKLYAVEKIGKRLTITLTSLEVYLIFFEITCST